MDFRTLKKELEKVFSDIVHGIDTGTMPEQEVLQDFVRLARMMPVVAEEEWIGEAEDFAHLATQLLQAAKQDDFKAVVLLADSLNDAQKFCHKSFR